MTDEANQVILDKYLPEMEKCGLTKDDFTDWVKKITNPLTFEYSVLQWIYREGNTDIRSKLQEVKRTWEANTEKPPPDDHENLKDLILDMLESELKEAGLTREDFSQLQHDIDDWLTFKLELLKRLDYYGDDVDVKDELQKTQREWEIYNVL